MMRSRRISAAHDAEGYALSVLAFLDADVTGDLPRLRCPVLLVPSRHDLLLPPALALNGEGAQFLPYQRPAAFAARVLAFLGGE
jgi:3-oxoadipate enol-lactonase